MRIFFHFSFCWLLLAGSVITADELPKKNPYGTVSVPFNVQQVPDMPVYFTVGTPGVPSQANQGHTSNAGFIITDDGVVVYDALGTPALGYELLRAIRERTDQPVKMVVVGHYHADHIYGLQAFREFTDAELWAHVSALDYIGSETAARRLDQRRETLAPWVSNDTAVIAPDHTVEAQQHEFQLGGVDFNIIHMGPAHSPSDAVLLVRQHAVVFSGDLIYGGRIPFLDSDSIDTARWLAGLDILLELDPSPTFLIPGHGPAATDLAQRLSFTRDYINYLRDEMGRAADELIPFDEAYRQTDWSVYQDLPAFQASNRGNAYRVFLEMEAAGF